LGFKKRTIMTFKIQKPLTLLLLSGAMLLGPTSCKDFLEEMPPSNLTPDSFYTIPDHAESAIVSVYADMRGIYGGAGIFSSTWQMLEAPTGTSGTETAQNSDLNNLYSLVYDGNTGHIINLWNSLYRVIANANLVLEKVPAITPMNADQKARILAEARFLRAWSYFHAVRVWGDVPLVLTPQTTSTPEFNPGRIPQEQVYTQIVNDLVEAEKAPLAWMNSNGRVGMAAVKSQLAKVYLTMAGFPLSKGASHFTLAANKSLEVITYSTANPTVVGLFPTYMDVHDERLENRLEHLFSLQYNVLVAGNPMGNMFPNFKPVTWAGQGGTGSSVPVAAFFNSYETGDFRARDQDGWFYTTYFNNGNGARFSLGAPYIFKHFNFVSNGREGTAGTRNDNLNVPLMRYAEVLLMYAEAQNELGAPNQAAYDAYKRIRDRARLTTPALGTFTQATFREAVWRERWWELCYEQITWFDMVRLRRGFNPVTKSFDNFVGHVLPSSRVALQATQLLFPIPRPELLNNPNLKTQNPGYPN